MAPSVVTQDGCAFRPNEVDLMCRLDSIDPGLRAGRAHNAIGNVKKTWFALSLSLFVSAADRPSNDFGSCRLILHSAG